MAPVKRASEWIELLANVGSIFVFVVLLGVFAQRYVTHRFGLATENEELQQGVHISLPGIHWADAHSTLILVLSVRCPSCTSSADFYRRLLGLNVGRHFRSVALFPPNENDGEAYLKSLGLAISDVTRADFATLGVHETPTLIVVNEAGRVRFLWRGKLTAEGENNVISRLGLDEPHKMERDPSGANHPIDVPK